MRTKRFPFHTEQDELFKKIHPIVLNVFCNGIMKAKPRELVLVALIIFASIPFSLITTIFHKSIHLLILFLTWWFLSAELEIYPILEKLLLTFAFLAIFYKNLYEDISSILLHFLIVVTAGKFLLWLCIGYLSGKGFRHNSFTGKRVENLVAIYSAVLPTEYRDQYDEFLDLYSGSNKPENEEKLERLIEEYWQSD